MTRVQQIVYAIGENDANTALALLFDKCLNARLGHDARGVAAVERHCGPSVRTKATLSENRHW